MVTRRTVLAAAALVLASSLHCDEKDCSAGITDVHLQRVQSYANFIKLLKALVDLYTRQDYVATLTTIAATIDNPTVKQLADGLIALQKGDALEKIKARLPALARAAVELALKVGDPGRMMREAVVEILKKTTFLGDVDKHAAAIEALPIAIPAARAKKDRLALADAAKKGADGLRYFRGTLESLRSLGATTIPHVDVSLFDAIAFCTDRPVTAITDTIDASLRDSLEIIAALDHTVGLCVGE